MTRFRVGMTLILAAFIGIMVVGTPPLAAAAPSANVPSSGAVRGEFSIVQTLVNPRFGNRVVTVSGSLSSDTVFTASGGSSGTFPDAPFNGLQITSYSIAGAQLDAPTHSDGFTRTRHYKGKLTGSVLTVSGTTSELYGTCNTAYGSFKVKLDVSVTVNGVTREYHSPEPCTQPAGSPRYEVKQGGGHFSVSVPIPAAGSVTHPTPSSKRGWTDNSIMPTTTEVPCTVTSHTGDLEIRYRDTEQWVPVPKNSLVRIGDTLRFKDYGRASLVFPDGSVFRMKSKTELTLQNEGADLRTGEANFSVQKQGKNFQVVTPSSALGVLGTQFSVVVADRGRTIVKVFEGQIQAVSLANRQSAMLSTGQAMTITAAGLGVRTVFDAAAERAQWDRDIPLPSSATRQASAGPPGCAREITIFSNNNIAGVMNGPTAETRFRIDRPVVLTYLMSYHWNNGRGQAVGGIGLLRGDGKKYGPWQATALAGEGVVPNVYWTIRTQVILDPGVYTFIDTDRSTWAQNDQSQGQGIVEVKGCVLDR